MFHICVCTVDLSGANVDWRELGNRTELGDDANAHRRRPYRAPKIAWRVPASCHGIPWGGLLVRVHVRVVLYIHYMIARPTPAPMGAAAHSAHEPVDSRFLNRDRAAPQASTLHHSASRTQGQSGG